jgi:hypothetical protein
VPQRREFLATATLRLDRDAALLSQLGVDATPCLVHPLPADLNVGHSEDEGLKFDKGDGYDAPLTFTTTGDLRNLRIPDDVSACNRAVLDFLLTLPPDARVVFLLVLMQVVVHRTSPTTAG